MTVTGEEASSAMNVNGVGGAASLPMTLPSPSTPPATTSVTGPPTTGSTHGDVRMPGQQRASQNEATERPQKEIPKPAPLPPLRGLTVAEIRAMLGVAPMPGPLEAATAAASGKASIMSAAFDRYA